MSITLITGASRGVGAELAWKLAGEGRKVAALARSGEKLEALRRLLAKVQAVPRSGDAELYVFFDFTGVPQRCAAAKSCGEFSYQYW